jgi:YD repeat-containing protein
MGWCSLTANPDTGKWTVTYASGRPASRTDAMGKATAFTYDQLARLLTNLAHRAQDRLSTCPHDA